MTDGHTLREAIRQLVLEIQTETQAQNSAPVLGNVVLVNGDGTVNVNTAGGIVQAGSPRTLLVGTAVTVFRTQQNTFIAL